MKYIPQKYEKVNRLAGRDHMGAIEKDIVTYALYKLRNDQLDHPDMRYTDGEIRMGIHQHITIEELKRDVFPDRDASNFSRDLARAAGRLVGYSTRIEGDHDNWTVYPMIKTIKFRKNSGLDITFHEEASPLIANLGKKQEGIEAEPFTVLDYKIVHSLKKTYSKTIYEFIYKEYKKKNTPKHREQPVKVFVDLIDFKTGLGIIDDTNEEVKKLLGRYPLQTERGYDPEERLILMDKLTRIDEGLSFAQKRKGKQVCLYNDFNNFNRYVLKVAKKEMDELDNFPLTFHYVQYNAPGSKKCVALYIYIYEKANRKKYENAGTAQMKFSIDETRTLNYESYEDDIPAVSAVANLLANISLEGAERFLERWSRRQDLPGFDLSDGDQVGDAAAIVKILAECLFDGEIDDGTCRNVVRQSEGDLNRIIRNLRYTKDNADKAQSINAYLVAAVRDDYASRKCRSRKGSSRKNSFNAFEQRTETDYAELERRLTAIAPDRSSSGNETKEVSIDIDERKVSELMSLLGIDREKAVRIIRENG